jgi:hypothetical protein
MSGIEAREVAEGMKKRPFCAEMIKGDAKVCCDYGRDLDSAVPASARGSRSGYDEGPPVHGNLAMLGAFPDAPDSATLSAIGSPQHRPGRSRDWASPERC